MAADGAGVRRLWASMLFAVTAVAAVAYWDARREAASALEDFATAQVALARGLADPVGARLATADPSAPLAPLVQGFRRVEIPGHVEILFGEAGKEGLVRADGTPVRHAAIEAAIARRVPWVRLSREEAGALGLPARTAIAGLAPLTSESGRAITVAVVATAQEGRERELRAQWRLVLAIVVGGGLVFAFGGLALRTQRKELDLARELAVAGAERRGDERLVRADKLATMGAMATGIAHEVSTPLGVIVGRAEQLRPKVEGDERARRAVDAILEQGERIGRVIRGFLALARGESPAFERVEPAAIARASVDLVQHRFAKAGVELRSDVADGLPAIACEPRLLEQAVVNLLLNACDACEAGGSVALTVAREGARIAFVVTDDGAGIPEESAARVGEPFFTTKPAGKGTGLGLAITSEIVKHHRGELRIVPRKPEKGTRASIEVPAAPAEESRAK
jgi:signal transduction histidine kinase